MTHLRGLACRRALNWRSTSDEMVTVWPNMTCPTSMVTLFAAFTASASWAAAEEKPRGPCLP